MSPEVERAATKAAGEVLTELDERGLLDLVVRDRDVIWVESPRHETPVPLHDADDVRWFALEAARA